MAKIVITEWVTTTQTSGDEPKRERMRKTVVTSRGSARLCPRDVLDFAEALAEACPPSHGTYVMVRNNESGHPIELCAEWTQYLDVDGELAPWERELLERNAQLQRDIEAQTGSA